jgi:photosystem II stability/assembly factor-like uncharacterized protein
MKHSPIFIPILLLTLTALAQHPGQPTLAPQTSGTTQLLIAVSPVNPQVVWASGGGGTFVVTTDGGAHWRSGVVPGAESLQFRDVQGVSDKVAYLMSIGNNPSDFRIYKTVDGGAHWTMQFQNQLKGAFYDCMAFWTPDRGIAVSDSVNGVFPDLRTTDGQTWSPISANLPPALKGEGSFASSGTCVATLGNNNAWIATGASTEGASTMARVLVTHDGGNKWQVHDAPFPSSATSGAFTVAFRDALHGMVGGGSNDPKDTRHAATAVSSDGGKTWALTSKPPVTGTVFGLAYAGGAAGVSKHSAQRTRAVVITANTGGAAWTPDEGATWESLDGVTGYWAVAFASPKAGWLVGTKGRILKISF